MERYTPTEQKKKIIKATLIGSLLDATLGVTKILVGILFNSLALIIDGIHSFSDLLTDALVVFVASFSHEAPDSEHPYGHGRFETVGTIAIGTLLFTVAGIIAYDSIRRLSLDGMSHMVPGWTALIVALVSIITKELIYRYTKNVAEEIGSSLLLANAWHSRTDALSSVAVLIGIFGARFGYPAADILAALFVALMIAKIAWDLISSSIKELVDTALPRQKLELIRQHIKSMEGIIDAHSLRSRFHAGQVLLDIHVQVNGMISVSEGHFIADRITESIMINFPNVADVLVHIDPENDGKVVVTDNHLPNRREATEIILQQCQSILGLVDVKKIDLHYLHNQIQAEIVIENDLYNKELSNKSNELVNNISWLKGVQIYGSF